MAESYLTDRNYDQAIAVLEKAVTYTPKETFVLGPWRTLTHAQGGGKRRSG